MKIFRNCRQPIAKNGSLFAVICLAIISLCGCVREDESDCPSTSGVILKYKYDMNMEYADLFDQKVDNLQAFIFNQQGVLCDTLTPFVGMGTIVPGWQREVNLAPGQYSVVTWAGSDKFCDFHFWAQQNAFPSISSKGVEIGKTRIEDFRLFLSYQTLSEPNAVPLDLKLKDLYHGLVQNIVVKDDQKTVVNTALIKNTNTVRLKIAGLKNLNLGTTADDFEFSIQCRNGHYKYDNTINEKAHLINYSPYQKGVDADSVIAKVNTLRLTKPTTDPFENGKMLLNITYKPTNMKICQDVDLVDLILSGRVVDRDSDGNPILDEDNNVVYTNPTLEYLDRQDLFEVTYEITKDDDDRLVMTVFVNDWKISNIYPAFTQRL